ncbi:DDB1- and CUL4-associated factor 8 [Cyphomyrmex costatus]|uniref:DDB1-and CUL4-associated factor 8 n=1 Tax=Cyphomyrmex costatus TaxID=456900 RepID=A0A151IHI4_9HYME|nr:DDB1- and CUL4-associated factor 8 [Cyphomyrmex costatus]
MEQQNYEINESDQNESLNTNSRGHTAGSETSINYQSNPYRHEVDWNELEAINEDELEEQERGEDENKFEMLDCPKIKKISPNWHIVPEMINRQIGSNPLFQRRFYGSLYAVERMNLMYKLHEEDLDCIINGLDFNENGNLLANGVSNTISIWDWTVGKRLYCITINSISMKWLPLKYFIIMSGEDGWIRLLGTEYTMSHKLAKHHGRSYKLAVHPQTPHVIISAGSDSRVLSIDIRESEPNELLVVEENSSKVLLYSVHSNPSNSNEFCVAGKSYYTMVYDRRKVSKPLYKLWPNNVENNKNVFVMSAMYNYNGTEILASYNNKYLFLFNKLMSDRGDYGHIIVEKSEALKNSDLLIFKLLAFCWLITVLGNNFFGPKSEYIVSGSANKICIWDKNSESIVQHMVGDKESVNYLEGHPHIPILATSGCDHNIKLWMPSKGKLSMLEMPLLRNYELENSNRDEDNSIDDDDDDDIFDDDSDDGFSTDNSSIEDNQSESGDVERIHCPPS